MKEAFDTIVGNVLLRNRLKEDILSQKLSHAYLIEGKAGLGKHLLALQIAAALACENKENDGIPLPCKICPSCKKILSGNSPDVIFINRGDKATMGVETVRSMHSDVLIPPNECENKIYIIEDAHLMTPQAQNAFLLTLEEPPAYVRFFLLCESSSLMLETIRSRAATFRLEPLSNEVLKAELCKSDIKATELAQKAPAEFAELIAAASGSFGLAKKLLDPAKRLPILEERENARTFLNLALEKHNSAKVLPFLSSLGQKREELIAQMNVFLFALRDLLLCKQTENAPLCFFYDREEALSLSYRFSSPDLLRNCEMVSSVCDRLRMNANIRLTLISFAVDCELL